MSALESTGGGPAEAAFMERKARNVEKAEAMLAAANARLEAALRDYDAEVARHEARGDGFFSTTYLARRKEAVLARKHFESRTSALNTARAELAASLLPLGGADE